VAFSRFFSSSNETRGNGLVYALWGFGILVSMVSILDHWEFPITNRDFVSFWVAGKLAIMGQAAQAYDVETLRASAHALAGTTAKIAFPYPPHMLFIAIALSLLPVKASFFLWQAVSAALFYLAAKPHLPKSFPGILVVLTPAALINVSFGQVGFFFGSLWLFAFSGSALAAATLTFKPHLGFLVGAEVIRRRQILITSLIAIAIIGLSLAAFGIDAWRASLLSGVAEQWEFMSSGAYPNWYIQMTTPFLGYGFVGWLLFAAAALFLLIRRFTVFTAATATFLIAPYGLHYDMTVACLGFGVLLFQHWREMPAWQSFVCAMAFFSPIVVAIGTWLVPPLLLVVLYIQTDRITVQTEISDGLERAALPI
jgi:hypothetical protein